MKQCVTTVRTTRAPADSAAVALRARGGRRALENKLCLITGASGIAAAAASAAAEAGAVVFVVSLHEQECAAVTRSLKESGGKAGYAVADLTSDRDVAAAVKRCVERFERVDALFNCVGISSRQLGDGPVHQCTEAAWQTTLDVNLKSAFLMSRTVLPVMMTQPIGACGCRGSILNMTSVLAFSPSAEHFATHAYAASKGAIISLTESMAAYYARHKIRVNAIAPGLVRTPMSRRAQEDPSIVEFLKIKQPLKRGFLDTADIADAAVFLLSDRARGITGITMPVDGGWCVSG